MIQNIKAVPGTVETQITAHNAHIRTHDLVHLLLALADEHHLFGVLCAFVVPLGNVFAEIEVLDALLGMFGGCLGIDYRLDERVACQAVAAVQTRARALAHGKEPLDRRACFQVNLDTATQVVGSRNHRYVVLGDIDAQFQTMLVDVGEVVFGLFGIFVGHIKVHMVFASLFHFAVDGACHHIAWSKRQARVILLHEFLASQVAQHGAIAAHSLGDEEGGAVAGVIQGGGVELDEFHVLHRSFGTINHSNAVACGNERIGGGLVHRAHAASRHERHARKESVHLARFLVEHIGTIALDARCAARHDLAQMVLGENLDGKVVVEDVDVLVGAHCLNERGLYLMPRVVGMVQDAELRVSAFAMQVELAFLVLVKFHAPLDEFPNLCRALCHHLLHSLGVAQPVACHHGVVNVFLEVVHLKISHCCHTALSQVGIGFFERTLAYQRHRSSLGHLERKTHAGHA